MTIGRPCVEREHSPQHAESHESHREQEVLPVHGDITVLGNFDYIHRMEPRLIIDTQDTDHQQSRTTHQHQGQFHCRIVLSAASPNTYQQVHGNKRHFVEHEHGKKVHRNKETEYTGRQQHEPQEIFFGKRIYLPRSEHSGKYNNRRKQ